ncbi:MAG TPA: hypothetical protein VM261_08360 [Kofleriaceae bacterium]|nr:hypothetical protein [Kofleriaceae bacterium]
MTRAHIIPAVAAVLVASGLTGCFDPAFDQPMCGPGGACPPGLTCSNANVCVAAMNDAVANDTLTTDSPDLPDGPLDVDAMCTSVCVDSATLRECVNGEPMAMTCAHGCSDATAPHCRVLVPSNEPLVTTALLTGVTASIDTGTMSAPWQLDADTGQLVSSLGTTVRAAGTGVQAGIGYAQDANVGVFTFRRFEIKPGTEIRVTGTRALVIFAGEDLIVSGRLIVSSVGGVNSTRGPGGGRGGSSSGAATGCGPGTLGGTAANNDSGGGGGGAATAGGRGGGSDAGVSPLGGVACGTAELVPLLGGSGGGRGGGAAGGVGGGGGGAVQLVALGSLTITGVIQAGGRGGGSGATDDAGGGGGAGGGILVEAPVVNITSAGLYANGGAGGAPGVNGEDGRESAQQASCGSSPGWPSCDGGLGGAGVQPPTNGSNNCGNPLGTAGGGGSSGRIRINAGTLNNVGAVISPAATMGSVSYQ